MSLFLLYLLLRPVIASPVDSLSSQAVFVHDKPGWYDPRERGGQFLDVSGLLSANNLSVLMSS